MFSSGKERKPGPRSIMFGPQTTPSKPAEGRDELCSTHFNVSMCAELLSAPSTQFIFRSSCSTLSEWVRLNTTRRVDVM